MDDPMLIWLWLVIGAIAGWLASVFATGGSRGLTGDIIVGVVGAVIAGYVLPFLGFFNWHSFFPGVINAVVGAVVLLVIVRLATLLLSPAKT